MSEDQQVSQRYRELGSEEPPRHVDEAILAASRRAADLRPAPLVPPTGRRRWYFPVAAAAVITLAVAVTWHMQLGQPDPYGDASLPGQPPKEEAQARREKEERSREPLLAKRPEAPASARAPERKAFAEAPARADAQARSAPAEGMVASQAIEPPEKALERIVALRKAGKHEEADKALEEFRKRYPDYKVPEAALRGK